MRRTRAAKIVCTLGPSSSSRERIKELFMAGADVFRLNFSHGTHEEHTLRYNAIREIEEELARPIGVIMDLQGPKIRVQKFENGAIELENGSAFKLDSIADKPGTKNRVAITNPEIYRAVKPGTKLLLDDGKIRLEVREGGITEIETVVRSGGVLSDHKGLNIPDTVLPMSPLTDKDRMDLQLGLELGVDWVALSFVQRPEDIYEARSLISTDAGILAKIEKPAAIEHLDEIIELSDAVMVARGDLGVEAPPEDVPGLQKLIIQKARMQGKPVIVATQMLESMITAPTPTRAEASDVANAIFEGTDAVMLSAETAAGNFPLESVAMMNRIINQVEQDDNYNLLPEISFKHGSDADAITTAARQVAETIEASTIVTFTETGSTTLRASKVRPNVPILALTPRLGIARQLALAWGVHSLQTEDVGTFDDLVAHTINVAAREEFAKPGQRLVVTAGVPFSTPGTTNILHIIKVE